MSAVYAGGNAVAAFNVICLEHAEAIAGAEMPRLPVILQVSESTVAYHGPAGPDQLRLLRAGGDRHVPVAVHLDHATSEDLCIRAIHLGYSSVMFDASTLPYTDNVRSTAALAGHAHGLGAPARDAIAGEVRRLLRILALVSPADSGSRLPPYIWDTARFANEIAPINIDNRRWLIETARNRPRTSTIAYLRSGVVAATM